jgi:hypothetical protein
MGPATGRDREGGPLGMEAIWRGWPMPGGGDAVGGVYIGGEYAGGVYAGCAADGPGAGGVYAGCAADGPGLGTCGADMPEPMNSVLFAEP